jgi:hypothetical protein
MPTSNEDFFTRERMQAIGLGIGRGFQSYDPNNPFAGAGAAMEATIGTEMNLDQRRKERAERLADLDAIRKEKLDAERRVEEAAIRQDERTLEQARKMGDLDTEVMIERQRRQEAEEKARRERMAVVGISRGLRTQSPDSRDKEVQRQFTKDFMRIVGGDIPKIAGSPPIDPYESVPELERRGMQRGRDYSMPEDKPVKKSRGMMRTFDGRMVKAIEDTDQETPVFGEGGRDYAY